MFDKSKVNPVVTSLPGNDAEDGALFNVLPAFDHILSRLEIAKITYANNDRLLTCINLAWLKMREYYTASDISKVYLVTSVLDPWVKMRYFKQNWEQSCKG